MGILSFWILLYAAPFIISPGENEVIIDINDVEFYVDENRSLDFEHVSRPSFQNLFNKDINFGPQDYQVEAAYWIKLNLVLEDENRKYLLEFYDQTIDSISVYVKHESDSTFQLTQLGDVLDFHSKPMAHKNFQVPLLESGKYICYIRIASHNYADIRIAVRSYSRFVEYAIVEYFLYGIFYGMILIISLYNMLIYSAIREVKYLYYTFYILSVGVFAMSVDGVAYQFLWPKSPYWNQIAHGVAMFMVIFWSILFSKKFLNLKIRAPKFDKALNIILGLRILIFIYALIFDHDVLSYRNIELVPLVVIFASSISVYYRGYQPARFFIVAFGFLFLGFLIKALLMVSVIPFYILSYYSLHICFVFEMLFLSFALSDRVRILKSNRDRALRRIIHQHEKTAKLKDEINTRLENQVSKRTAELAEKNQLLEKQKEDISQINSLLDLDNYRLRNNIKSIQRERIQNKELTYQEFREVFTAKDDCLAILEAYKWNNGYSCHKCGNRQYSAGSTAKSRRCTKCGYQESPTTHTLFHGLRFPIEKAFYLLYETLNKDQYSLSQLSEMLDLRKNTVMDFKKRIKAQDDSENEKFIKMLNQVDLEVNS